METEFAGHAFAALQLVDFVYQFTLLQWTGQEEQHGMTPNERRLDKLAINGVLDAGLVVPEENDQMFHFFSFIISA